MTGEVIWRSKLRCRERGQVQVARSSPTPPTSKIYYSFHTVSHVDPVWKKKKKRTGEKCTPWRLCRTTRLVIRRFISGRVRSERDGLIAFRISLTSSTNSPTRAFCLCADTGKNGKSNSSLVYDDGGLVDEFFQKLPSMQLSHLTG